MTIYKTKYSSLRLAPRSALSQHASSRHRPISRGSWLKQNVHDDRPGQVKCPGNAEGMGCLNCRKKGVQCNFSVKKKPGPKGRKRAVDDMGQDTAVPAHLSSATGLATVGVGVGGSDVGGDGDGKGGGLPRAISPSSRQPSTPSKRLKKTHGQSSCAVRQQPKHLNIPPPGQVQHVLSPTPWGWGSTEKPSPARPALVLGGVIMQKVSVRRWGFHPARGVRRCVGIAIVDINSGSSDRSKGRYSVMKMGCASIPLIVIFCEMTPMNSNVPYFRSFTTFSFLHFIISLAFDYLYLVVSSHIQVLLTKHTCDRVPLLV